ncbi:MAG: hypothetical protein IJF33_05340, partial [Clostridia bacterium]|nr:hypothetical protein [Clostridia bacterium]
LISQNVPKKSPPWMPFGIHGGDALRADFLKVGDILSVDLRLRENNYFSYQNELYGPFWVVVPKWQREHRGYIV